MVLEKEKRHKKEILVVILSHDRLETIIETISSVINSSDGLADIVVSDNSLDPAVPLHIKKQFSDIPLIIQADAKGAIAHLNAVMNLATSQSYKYLTIFHDDDLMLKDYILNSVTDLKFNNQLIATACNAFIETDGVIKGTFYKKGRSCLFSSHSEFLSYYLNLSREGVAPFPGYMYRLSRLAENRFDILKGGRHGDVSFLNELLKKGQIHWRNDVGMIYRVHSGGSSGSECIADRKSLIKYASRFISSRGHLNPLKTYRCYYIIRKKRFEGKSLVGLMLKKRYRKICISFFLNVINARYLQKKQIW
jgi:hypothetical protein